MTLDLRISPLPCTASSPLPMPARITSPSRFRTRQRTVRPGHTESYQQFHEGADFHAPDGTPVFAVRPGVVALTQQRSGYGNLVVLYHPEEDLFTAYAHLQAILVETGATVRAGTVIAASGHSSNGAYPTMPPHLHFAVRRWRQNGQPPWPAPYPDPNGPPAEQAAFRTYYVNPSHYLSAIGLVPSNPHGAGILRIRRNSPADCGDGRPVAPSPAPERTRPQRSERLTASQVRELGGQLGPPSPSPASVTPVEVVEDDSHRGRPDPVAPQLPVSAAPGPNPEGPTLAPTPPPRAPSTTSPAPLAPRPAATPSPQVLPSPRAVPDPNERRSPPWWLLLLLGGGAAYYLITRKDD